MNKIRLTVLVGVFLIFLLSPWQVYAASLPPTDSLDSLSYVVYQGKLRELAIKGNMVWWRDSPDTTEKNLPADWTSKLLSEAWGPAVSPAGHPLPTSNIDSHAYQQFSGCGSWGNKVTELVIKGGDLWYRRSQDITGTNLGSTVFSYTTLASSWGTSGPPTDSIDSIHYDTYDGSPRELVLKGGNVWVRSLNCATSQWSGWSSVSLTQAWGSTTNYPPLTGGIDAYATDYVASDNSLEIVTQGNNVWSRRSSDTNSHHASDVWRKTDLNNLWQRNNASLSNSDIAGRFIDKFLSVYGDTNFSDLINYQYPSAFDSQNNFRALLGQALAHAVRYRLSNNSSAGDLQKAKSFINAGADRYSTWGKTFLSGDAVRSMLLSSWVIWDQLTDAEKSKIQSVAKQDADYWSGQKPLSGYQSDTKAEENGGVVGGLAFSAVMFPDDPSAGKWEQAARCFAFHTITTGETSCGVTTQTVYSDFTLDNHDYHPSVLYTLAALAPLDQAGLGYYLAGYQIPGEFKHNTVPIWDKFFTYFHPGDYTIYKQFFRGLDWGDIDVWLAMTDINYLALIDNSSGLSSDQAGKMAGDILHYFYSVNRDVLRFPGATPVASMPPDSAPGSVTNKWFLNSLTHAKGAAEIAIYSNPQFFFCRGNVDIRGKSTHLCDPAVPVKEFSVPLQGDWDNNGSVNIADLVYLFSNFTNIFDYNHLVANYGK